MSGKERLTSKPRNQERNVKLQTQERNFKLQTQERNFKPKTQVLRSEPGATSVFFASKEFSC